MNPFKHIGIIGEGKMGTNLFYFLLDHGCFLRWICSGQAEIEKIRKTFLKRIFRAKDSGIITQAGYESLLNGTLINDNFEAISDCDLVIEAVTEDISTKKEIFKDLVKLTRPGTIIASNSSSILPGKLLPSIEQAPFFLGLHFFYPVALKNIVEVITPESLSTGSLDKIKDFLTFIDRRYIVLDENSAFILNRIFLDFQNEAFLLAFQGKISFARLDSVVREHFFPVGVFEFFDSVGIDLMLTSIRNYVEHYLNRDHYSALIGFLDQMVRKGHLGKKSSKGFYQYSGDQVIEPDFTELSRDVNTGEITEYLRFQFQGTVRRYTVQSGLSLVEMNEAIREYFSIEKGPFDF
ncbi:MAG: 3-hydroxyacyl-CoA dehydrogenase family protein [bacterium]